VLIIFAKAPVDGTVKTRLIPEYSPSQAASIHQQLLEFVLERIAFLQGFDIELHCAPDQNHEFFKALKNQYQLKLKSQTSGDLGQRMNNTISQALTEYKKVVLIGSDCPVIDSHYIQQAFNELEKKSTVLGPAEDGGYVLIGVTKLKSRLFKDIDWGSEYVLQQTLDQLEPEKPALMKTLWDVDRPEDVLRFENLNQNFEM